MSQRRLRDNDGCTPQEALFCKAYIVSNGNGKEAARIAGYSGSLTKRGCQLLDRPHIKKVIQRTFRAKLTRTGLINGC
jgi:phage terminase small subunit